MNKYEKIVLSNKAPILTVPLLEAQTITALIIFKTGSRYETKETNGLSHFLEHMFFKGTVSRPSTLAIASDLDALGCEFNAFTGKEYTGYWIKSAKNKLSSALEVLGDMLLNSKFDAAEIDREKGVIIEELNMYQDNPMLHIEDVLETCLYGDTPAGWETVGTKENIRRFTRQDFLDYFNSQYGANSAFMVLAGGVAPDHLVKAGEIMNQLKDNQWRDQEKNKYEQAEPKLLTAYKDIDQVNLSLAVRTFPLNHPEEFKVKLLAVILGGAMSSRLFINLRERNGLAYYVKTSTEFHSDSGYLTTQAGVPVDKVELSIEIIKREYAKLRNELIPEAELTRAKDLLQGRLLLQMEASDNLANWYARQLVQRPDIITPQDFIEKIKAITVQDLQATAQKIFVNEGLNLALIGKTREQELLPLLNF